MRGRSNSPDREQTRLSSEVFFFSDFLPASAGLEPKFKFLDKQFKPERRLFRADMQTSKDEMLRLAEVLLQREQPRPRLQLDKKSKREWREIVNQKRQRVADALFRSALGTLTSIARETHCHPPTMKSVLAELRIRGRLQPFDYPNQKSQHETAVLDQLLNDPAYQYLATTDYKRLADSLLAGGRTVSRKFIPKRLHASAKKYVKLKRSRKGGDGRSFDSAQLKTVVWTALQAMESEDEQILFMDEVEFPAYCTSDYAWCLPDGRPTYNRRLDTDSLFAICLCSKKRMVAAQVFTDRINKEAVHFFLTEVLKKLSTSQRLVILLDNAGWHKARLIMHSDLNRLLLFNVARCWEANLIENCFSKLKDKWRRRPVAATEQQEKRFIGELLMLGSKESDFSGYRRQYLRQLISLIQQL